TALADRPDRRARVGTAHRRRRCVLRRQCRASAQSFARQPARRLRPHPALPSRTRVAGRTHGVARRAARRPRPRHKPDPRSRPAFLPRRRGAALTMRVAVIGAVVIGVTTAYELGADGHDVTVFERRGTVAAESSFANAGLVAPGYVSPWAAPGMPGKVLSHLWRAHAPVRIGMHVDLSTLGWLWQWWRACEPQTYRANRARMHRLAHFSRERLHELTQRLHLDFERAEGVLVLLRSPRDLAMAEPGIRALAELGAAPQVLDAAACRLVEPGLNPQTPLHAGVYSKDDDVGNCREFTHLLRREAARRGVRFRFYAQVERIVAGVRPGLVVVRTPIDPRDQPPAPSRVNASDWPITQPGNADATEARFDAVIVCAALGSRELLRPLGVKLPLEPVFGYSVPAPLRHDEQHLHREPRAALMDERYKVAISRLGN